MSFSISQENPRPFFPGTMSNGLRHSSDATLSKPPMLVPFFSTQSLSEFFFQKHFSELYMNEAGSYNKLSWQVCAVNIPLVLRERVHPSICTEICKVLDRSIIKANDMWFGESPKDSFPKWEGEICGFTFSFATGQETIG